MPKHRWQVQEYLAIPLWGGRQKVEKFDTSIDSPLDGTDISSYTYALRWEGASSNDFWGSSFGNVAVGWSPDLGWPKGGFMNCIKGNTF